MKNSMYTGLSQGCAALLLLCLSAGAQFTVEDALSRTMATHPSMREALLAVEEAAGEALQAGLPPNPELDIGIEGWRSGEDGEWLAGVSQALPISGKRRLARKAGMAGVAAAEQETEVQRRALKAYVEQLFYETLATQERAAMTGEILEHATKVAALTRHRFEAGDIPEVDWMRAAAGQSRYQAELEEVHRLHDTLRTRLAVLCGLSVAELPECTGQLAPSPDMLPEDEMIQGRLQDTPKHAARALRKSQAEVETQALKRAALPEPTLRVGLRRERATDNKAIDIGVSIGLPLFDRNQGALAVSRARTRRIQAESEMALQAETHTALTLLGDARAASLKAARLRAEALPKLEEVYLVLEQALEIGGVSLFEVLTAQHEIVEMHIDLLELESKARFSLIELLALL